MTMQARSEAVKTVDGGTLELATIVHEGREFTAQGSYRSGDGMLIVAYVSSAPDAYGRYALRTWSGETIAPLTLTGAGRGGFYGSRITSWACVVDGYRYHGRNGGPGMVVRMRRGRKVSK